MMKKAFFLLVMIIFCWGCQPGNSEKSATDNLSQKGRHYYSNGKVLYETLCSNCHGEDGTGFKALIPPLKKSDYLLEDLNRAAIIIKFGQRGPITVNGQEFNQPMPANPKLTNIEIAELITYIGNSWGNASEEMTIAKVEAALAAARKN